MSFKPYYKWITFNTTNGENLKRLLQLRVLNLIINGLPSIPNTITLCLKSGGSVLNLIINGLPSIL